MLTALLALLAAVGVSGADVALPEGAAPGPGPCDVVAYSLAPEGQNLGIQRARIHIPSCPGAKSAPGSLVVLHSGFLVRPLRSQPACQVLKLLRCLQ